MDEEQDHNTGEGTIQKEEEPWELQRRNKKERKVSEQGIDTKEVKLDRETLSKISTPCLLKLRLE